MPVTEAGRHHRFDCAPNATGVSATLLVLTLSSTESRKYVEGIVALSVCRHHATLEVDSKLDFGTEWMSGLSKLANDRGRLLLDVGFHCVEKVVELLDVLND